MTEGKKRRHIGQAIIETESTTHYIHMNRREKSRRINYLKKVLQVQETHNAAWEEDQTKKFVHRKFIADKFCISYETYLDMLGINARRELKQLEGALQPTV